VLQSLDNALTDVLQCVAVCCSVLQCVAVCCSVLQCVAVRCSVLCSVLQTSERPSPPTLKSHYVVNLKSLRIDCCSVLQCWGVSF